MTNKGKILKTFAKGLLVLVLSFSVAFCSVIVLAAGSEPLDTAQNSQQVSATLYDRDAAVEYAQKHYRLANTEDYYNFGNFPSRLKYSVSYLVRAGNGDCANFTSQCLYAGGIAQNGDWYHYIYYNEPIKLKLFDKSIVLGYCNEAGKYTLNSVRYNFSAAWLGAISQFKYFSDKQNGYINGEVITLNSAEAVSKAAATENIQKGDLLFWSSNGETVAHVTLITDVTDSDIFYTGHSQIGFNRSVSKTIVSGDYKAVKIVRLKD